MNLSINGHPVVFADLTIRPEVEVLHGPGNRPFGLNISQKRGYEIEMVIPSGSPHFPILLGHFKSGARLDVVINHASMRLLLTCMVTRLQTGGPSGSNVEMRGHGRQETIIDYVIG